MKEILNLYEEIATSIAGMMGQQPINLAGKEMPSKKYSKETKNKQHNAMLGYKYQKSRNFKKNQVQ